VALVACRFGFDDGSSTDDGATGGTAADARMPTGDAGVCTVAPCSAAGGSCVDGVCEITANDESIAQCPAGMPCRLVCSGYRFCRDGARCGAATWCDVACVGYRACQFGVECAGTECFVMCNGEEACESGITVIGGGTCASHCCGIEACSGGTATCTTDGVCP
jgi:hypothetical protein